MNTNNTKYQDYDELSEIELTDEELSQMKPLKEVMPPEFVNMVLTHQHQMEAQGLMKPRTRGKQKTPTKQSVTIRLSPEVIAAFKATGQGWQTRINDALLQYIHTSL